MSFNEEYQFSRSSYRIAERNRLAKQKFLKSLQHQDVYDSSKMGRRKERDLSVPGTPVSSRHVWALKNGLDYDSDEDNDLRGPPPLFSNTRSKQNTDLMQAIETLNGEITQFRRTSTISVDINEPTILINRNDQDCDLLQKSYPRYSSVPGTPVSSRRILRYKIDDDVDERFHTIKSANTTDDGKSQLEEFIKSMEQLRADKFETARKSPNNDTNKFGYSSVGTYNGESNLVPITNFKTVPKSDSEVVFESNRTVSNNEEFKRRLENVEKLKTNFKLNTSKPKSPLYPGVDLLSPTLIRKQIANEGFYTRTYSRRISREETTETSDNLDNVEPVQNTKYNVSKVTSLVNDHHVNGGSLPKPVPTKRTSIASSSALSESNETNRPPLRRSVSNREKFYEILNKFRQKEI